MRLNLQLTQIRLLSVLALALIVSHSPVQAEERGNIELGMDAAIEGELLHEESDPLVELGSRRSFRFEVPSRVRIGFFPGRKTSLEVSLSFSSGETNNSSVRTSSYSFAVFHHFVREQFKITPYIGLTTLMRARGDDNDILKEQFAVGVVAGGKSFHNKLSPRIDLALYRRFKGDGFPASTMIIISGGISVFTGPAPN